MVDKNSDPKITYLTMSFDQEERFHARFDKAVDEVRNQFGKTYPNCIGGKDRKWEGIITSSSPINTRLGLGHFAKATKADVIEAIETAKAVFPSWRDTDWKKRISILRKVADVINERKFFISAVMSFETGKSRMESMGEVEESADMARFYSQQVEDANGFVQQMGRLSPNENVKSVLRPYGVWAVISPFNFPLALACGMSLGALLAGNTVVFKPSSDTPWMGYLLNEIFKEAGIPDGVFNLVCGSGSVVGQELASSSKVDGLIFTGSKEVGMSFINSFSQQYPKPCITEMGGKNSAIVTAKADLEKAAKGVMRAAFGFGGQKCSACSRVYISKQVEKDFLKLLVQKTQAIKIGDPTQRDIFLGPLVNERAYRDYQSYIQTIKQDGTILTGGNILTEEPFNHGYFVEPTIVIDLPKDHKYFYEELFVPILVVAPVESLDEAIELSNRAEYGLTAGIFSEDMNEVNKFFDNIESGVCYANREGGATTGAWPGIQPFCGWKGSGSSGKGCCGNYYVQQFMREQARTIME